MGVWVYPIWRATEKLAYLGPSLSGDAMWRQKVSRTFLRLQSDPKLESRLWSMDETPFVREGCKALRNLPESSDLSPSRRKRYQKLVVGSSTDPFSEWYSWTVEKVRSHWNWAPGSGFVNNSEFLLARNTMPLLVLNFRAGLANMPDCACYGSGLEETAEHSFSYCQRICPFWDHVGEWTALIGPKQLGLLDVGYVVDNVLPLFQGEKRVVLLAILAVARIVIWTTQKQEL